jgi:hypothetical protein
MPPRAEIQLQPFASGLSSQAALGATEPHSVLSQFLENIHNRRSQFRRRPVRAHICCSSHSRRYPTTRHTKAASITEPVLLSRPEDQRFVLNLDDASQACISIQSTSVHIDSRPLTAGESGRLTLFIAMSARCTRRSAIAIRRPLRG